MSPKREPMEEIHLLFFTRFQFLRNDCFKSRFLWEWSELFETTFFLMSLSVGKQWREYFVREKNTSNLQWSMFLRDNLCSICEDKVRMTFASFHSQSERGSKVTVYLLSRVTCLSVCYSPSSLTILILPLLVSICFTSLHQTRAWVSRIRHLLKICKDYSAAKCPWNLGWCRTTILSKGSLNQPNRLRKVNNSSMQSSTFEETNVLAYQTKASSIIEILFRSWSIKVGFRDSTLGYRVTSSKGNNVRMSPHHDFKWGRSSKEDSELHFQLLSWKWLWCNSWSLQ